ncbi:MAG: hypothetical protein AAF748_06655 [Pseudomonadota bacterium]
MDIREFRTSINAILDEFEKRPGDHHRLKADLQDQVRRLPPRAADSRVTKSRPEERDWSDDFFDNLPV